MYKYIFFDLDGTLTNSKEGIIRSLEYAFLKLGVPSPDDSVLDKFIGPPLSVSFRDFLGFDEEISEKAIEKYRERYVVEGIYENYPYDGIKELLAEVKNSGKILAVATSKPEFMAKEVCDHFGLTEYFATVAGSANESEGKADVIIKAFDRLAIPESERDCVLMVGDRMHDILGAHKCGIKCCGVGYGFAPEGEFEEYGADYVTATVDELKRFLINI